MKKYLGTSFSPKGSMHKRWKAQIVRKARTIQLGAFETQEEAAKAYDNAAYHLREWSDRPVAYNWPENFEKGKFIEPANAATLSALAKLQEIFPEFGKRLLAGDSAESEDERLDREGQRYAQDIKVCVNRLAPIIDKQAATIRMLRARLDSAQKENAQLLRTVEGLRAQGGQQIFTPVIPGVKTEKVNQVESHLS